ncbi:cytochrome bd oxidase small subunit, CydX/CbdX family [Photobacterium makurazakiensis]
MWYLIWVLGLLFASFCGAMNGMRMERKERSWQDNPE